MLQDTVYYAASHGPDTRCPIRPWTTWVLTEAHHNESHKEPAAFAEHSPRADRRVDSCCHGDGFGAGKSRERSSSPARAYVAGCRFVEPDLFGDGGRDRHPAAARSREDRSTAAHFGSCRQPERQQRHRRCVDGQPARPGRAAQPRADRRKAAHTLQPLRHCRHLDDSDRARPANRYRHRWRIRRVRFGRRLGRAELHHEEGLRGRRDRVDVFADQRGRRRRRQRECDLGRQFRRRPREHGCEPELFRPQAGPAGRPAAGAGRHQHERRLRPRGIPGWRRGRSAIGRVLRPEYHRP